MRVKIVYDNLYEMTWAVRVVEQTDAYGLDDCLTHESKDPLVEFYDTRYAHTDLGQFVSRYRLSSLIEHRNRTKSGLQLDGGIPSWRISPKPFFELCDWLEENFGKDTCEELAEQAA